MGQVDIPDMPPPGGGRMSASIVLEGNDLMETVSLLRAVLDEYTSNPNHEALVGLQSGRAACFAAPAGPGTVSVPFAVSDAAVSTAASAPVPFAGPASLTSASARSAPLVHIPAPQPQPIQQQYTPQYQTQPQVQQPTVHSVQQGMAQLQIQQQHQQPLPASAIPQPRTFQQQAPVFQQQQQQPSHAPVPTALPIAVPQSYCAQQYAAAPSAYQPAASTLAFHPQSSSSAGATAGPAAAASSSRWQLVFTSDPDEHSNMAVSAVAYAPALPGLPGGDGHAGWLVSASKGLINLWETNRAATGEEMALLCMHSQAVDVLVNKIVLEPATKLCFGAALGGANAAECISVHSLDTETLLASRYKYAPPPNTPQSGKRLMQQVESLHGMSSALNNRILVSYGDRLLGFQTKSESVPTNLRSDAAKYTRTGSVLHDPEFHFVAHPSSVITALHRSPLTGSLLLASGAQDGKIHLWDLKAPPKQPHMRMLCHSKDVTALNLVSDDRLASSSLDGTVLLWDLRSPGSPLHKAVAPGGAAVLKIAAGPWGDVLAVSTATGLYCLELFDFEAQMAPIAEQQLKQPYTDIVFNAVTHDLYAACSDGKLQVFTRLS